MYKKDCHVATGHMWIPTRLYFDGKTQIITLGILMVTLSICNDHFTKMISVVS